MTAQELFLWLFSGLAGALIGGIVTFQAQRQARNADRKAAVRACMIELANNAAALDMAVDDPLSIPIVMTVWNANGPLVLSALSDPEAGAVAAAYSHFPNAEAVRQLKERGVPLLPWQVALLREGSSKAKAAGDVLLARLKKL